MPKLEFVWQRLPRIAYEAFFTCPEVLEIILRLTQAQCPVRSTPDLVNVVFVLTVVFPPADRTYLESSPAMQGLEFAAWTSICFFFPGGL
jgi:hypothetical protein